MNLEILLNKGSGDLPAGVTKFKQDDAAINKNNPDLQPFLNSSVYLSRQR
jgi:hypothetical protein